MLLATFERMRVNLIKDMHNVLSSPFGDASCILAIPQIGGDNLQPGVDRRLVS